MSKKDGGPVFPRAERTDYGRGAPELPTHVPATDGLSLRDWFAGQALAGLLRDTTNDITLARTQSYAICAYEVADAMLEARSK